MKYLKKYKSFFEDGTAAVSASSTAGMGAVSAAQPGGLPGTTGTEGSGDLGFVFKKEKRKKGDATKVTDLRDLGPSKEVTHVKESEMVLRPRDPAYDPETRKIIDNCLVELYDQDFELNFMDYDIQKHSVDLDDEETGYFSQEELRISLNKNIQDIWHGNMTITGKFDDNGIISTDISTLRGSGKSLNKFEQSLFDLVEEISQKLLGNLDYEKGSFRISFEVAGSAMPYAWSRNISVNVHFTLENNLKH
jgi:hypothetical protein